MIVNDREYVPYLELGCQGLDESMLIMLEWHIPRYKLQRKQIHHAPCGEFVKFKDLYFSKTDYLIIASRPGTLAFPMKSPFFSRMLERTEYINWHLERKQLLKGYKGKVGLEALDFYVNELKEMGKTKPTFALSRLEGLYRVTDWERFQRTPVARDDYVSIFQVSLELPDLLLSNLRLHGFPLPDSEV